MAEHLPGCMSSAAMRSCSLDLEFAALSGKYAFTDEQYVKVQTEKMQAVKLELENGKIGARMNGMRIEGLLQGDTASPPPLRPTQNNGSTGGQRVSAVVLKRKDGVKQFERQVKRIRDDD